MTKEAEQEFIWACLVKQRKETKERAATTLENDSVFADKRCVECGEDDRHDAGECSIKGMHNIMMTQKINQMIKHCKKSKFISIHKNRQKVRRSRIPLEMSLVRMDKMANERRWAFLRAVDD